MRPRPNPVVHLELHTAALKDASELYAALCRWRPQRIEASGCSYLALEMGNGLGGGIVECEAPHPIWLPYVKVGSVAEATDRARELGAAVLLGPREGPAGWRSVIASKGGGQVAFWQPKQGG
jgi:uncharacterized protein